MIALLLCLDLCLGRWFWGRRRSNLEYFKLSLFTIQRFREVLGCLFNISDYRVEELFTVFLARVS
jgi:hypothetical protein